MCVFQHRVKITDGLVRMHAQEQGDRLHAALSLAATAHGAAGFDAILAAMTDGLTQYGGHG